MLLVKTPGKPKNFREKKLGISNNNHLKTCEKNFELCLHV